MKDVSGRLLTGREARKKWVESGASFQIFLGGGSDGLASEASLISRVVQGGWRGYKPPPRFFFFYFELFHVLFEAI